MPGKNRSSNGRPSGSRPASGGKSPTMKFDRDEGSGLLPDAIYQLQVKAVEVKQSSGSEYPYLNVTFGVLFNGQPKGVPIYDVLSYSPNARFKFDQLFDAMNAPSSGEVSITWLKGKKVWASIITSTYKGRISNKVSQYLTPEVAQAQMALNEEDDYEDDDEVDDDDLTDDEDDLTDDEDSDSDADETYEDDEDDADTDEDDDSDLEDDDEDDDEEEIPPPAPVSKKGKTAAATAVVEAPAKAKSKTSGKATYTQTEPVGPTKSSSKAAPVQEEVASPAKRGRGRPAKKVEEDDDSY